MRFIIHLFFSCLLAISLCCLIIAISDEYKKRTINQCVLIHDASTTTLPCEYVDGIVKIKL